MVPQEVGGTPEQTEILDKDSVFVAASRLNAVARDKALLAASLAIVRRDPRSYAKLAGWRFFIDSWRPMPRRRNYDHSYRLIAWTSLLSDGWIIPLGFIGMLWAGLGAPAALWLYLLMFSETFVYSLIFTIIRYRFARMPILILYAALSLSRLWSAVKARGARRGGP